MRTHSLPVPSTVLALLRRVVSCAGFVSKLCASLRSLPCFPPPVCSSEVFLPLLPFNSSTVFHHSFARSLSFSTAQRALSSVFLLLTSDFLPSSALSPTRPRRFRLLSIGFQPRFQLGLLHALLSARCTFSTSCAVFCHNYFRICTFDSPP